MKKLYTTATALLLAAASFAQTPAITDDIEKTTKAVMEQAATEADSLQKASPWKSSGAAGLSLSQASFSNWNAGGDPAIAVNASFNYSLDYNDGSNLWTNRLELAYGINRTSTDGTRKTNDKIYLSSNYGRLIARKLYAGATATFNTQFAKGYDYKVSSTEYISDFMAPGYLSVGLGLTYTPTAWLTVIVSPATYRATFVCNDRLSDAGAFGVKAATASSTSSARTSGRRRKRRSGKTVALLAPGTLLQLPAQSAEHRHQLGHTARLRPDRMAHRQPLCQYDIRR